MPGDAYLQGGNLRPRCKQGIVFFSGVMKKNGSLFLERNLNMSSAGVSYHIAFLDLETWKAQQQTTERRPVTNRTGPITIPQTISEHEHS